MSSLFGALTSAAQSMQALQKGLEVVSNNVTNSKTPGYARQGLELISQPFSVELALTGGVTAGDLISSRDQYLERGVWAQLTAHARYGQSARDLSRIEPEFDISSETSLSAQMSRFFGSFHSLALNPNDLPARRHVLSTAKELASGFNRIAYSLGLTRMQADTDLGIQVETVNKLAGRLQGFNLLIREDQRRTADPGLDALIHSTLEELASYVDFSVLRGEDGTFQVYLGGQTPLVAGDKVFAISADFSGSDPLLRDAAGKDITGQVGQGSIRGLLDFRSVQIPGIQEDLNLLASTLADQVNQVLLQGVDLQGQAPAQGLFVYDPAAPAATLAVTTLQPSEIAAAHASAPGGNGNALDLGDLGNSPQVAGYTFSQYYGLLAGNVGRLLNDSTSQRDAHRMLLTQARGIRAEASDVSLDEEATKLIEFQRAYQAAAELVRVLNALTEETLRLVG